ncbi:type VII secretion target [Gordonia sp. DT30]|uniref:type VII secretion target n=1 Tax=Gordonia sp. DT30 TaxID=3416546 RepID=UPI003CFA161F
MQVDPQLLREFAQQTSQTASSIRSSTLAGVIVEAFSGMPGSTSAWASHEVDSFARDRTERLASGYDGLAVSARGSANNYEVAEADFTAAIKRSFPR